RRDAARQSRRRLRREPHVGAAGAGSERGPDPRRGGVFPDRQPRRAGVVTALSIPQLRNSQFPINAQLRNSQNFQAKKTKLRFFTWEFWALRLGRSLG